MEEIRNHEVATGQFDPMTDSLFSKGKTGMEYFHEQMQASCQQNNEKIHEIAENDMRYQMEKERAFRREHKLCVNDGRTAFATDGEDWFCKDCVKQMKKERRKRSLPITTGVKIGRNNPCPCGSGEKYKNCCLNSKRIR